jgi:hypothetical protein
MEGELEQMDELHPERGWLGRTKEGKTVPNQPLSPLLSGTWDG